MPPRACVFCGSPGVTREHVWPKWLGEAVVSHFGSPGKWAVTNRVVTRGASERTAHKLDATVKRVCAGCNSGWMSQLESLARPLILPMLFRQHATVELAPDAQRTIATWAVKTAMMSELLHPADALTQQAYSRFYVNRDPTGCTVWAAAYGDPELALLSDVRPIQVTASHSFTRDGIRVAEPVKRNAALSTLRLFSLVLQVLICDQQLPAGEWSDGDLLLTIWPPGGGTVRWPANGRALSDAAFEQLRERRGTLRQRRSST